jgi:hypothetical protein
MTIKLVVAADRFLARCAKGHTDVGPDVRVFQEFSNEERCKGAKSKLEHSLKDAGSKLRAGLDDLKKVDMGDPGQIIIAYNVECLRK